VDRKKPVLGGPVRSPQYLHRSWTGCGPRLPVLGTKNRTEPDLKTLSRKRAASSVDTTVEPAAKKVAMDGEVGETGSEGEDNEGGATVVEGKKGDKGNK
jgi:hypothetical protein